ncbi:MAG: DNA replication/repair protein RecF [bacterium]
MYLKNLQLIQFRNYKQEKLNFLPGLNVIYGQNACGKSNILEAIYLLVQMRSMRTTNVREAIQWGHEGFLVQGTFCNVFGDKEISLKVIEGGKRSIKINGKELHKHYELIGQVPVVLFVPDDLRIIKAEPEQRRKFLNSIIVQIDSNYFNNLLNYNKVLAERNEALRQFKAKQLGLDGITPWTEKLVTIGSEIIQTRNKYVQELNAILGEVDSLLGDAKMKLSILYKSFINEWEDVNTLKSSFANLIHEKQQLETVICQTLVGPHRDELEIFGNGKVLRAYGSQGQQRKAILSLKIASVLLLKKHFSEWPITLFDDVLSELDECNQKALEDILIALSSKYPSPAMSNWQCFITTADHLGRWDGKNINKVQIAQGNVCV